MSVLHTPTNFNIGLLRAVMAGFLITLSVAAGASEYPERTVRIITPFSAGSGADIVARQIAVSLSSKLGQSFIVDDRPGAGGDVGVAMAAREKPDGYTLVLGTTGPLTVNPFLHASLGFNPVKDFSPISLIAQGPLVIVVNASSPVKTLADLVQLAKSKPGALNYGSTGVGSSNHLAAALLSMVTGIQMAHVPYKGNSEEITDLIGGNLDVAFSGVPSVLALSKGGRIRPIAVTSHERLPLLPEVPTVGESGYEAAESSVWYGLLAPVGTPDRVISRLNMSMREALDSPTGSAAFGQLGLVPSYTTPDGFGVLIKSDLERWGKVVKATGMTAQ